MSSKYGFSSQEEKNLKLIHQEEQNKKIQRENLIKKQGVGEKISPIIIDILTDFVDIEFKNRPEVDFKINPSQDRWTVSGILPPPETKEDVPLYLLWEFVILSISVTYGPNHLGYEGHYDGYLLHLSIYHDPDPIFPYPCKENIYHLVKILEEKTGLPVYPDIR